ncbi:hypothetical protein BDF21DRAFT_441216 [Thamnidium elegans]|nr:hypothetical protein BDF21DRAFT_441216 [Thamnidium elegans]
MSNPIADTAEYFAEKDAIRQKPGLRIFPSQQATSTPHEMLSPESPESRRPMQISDFDPKLQWQKVLKRLPSRRHSSSRRSSQDDMNASTDSEASNEFEMSSYQPEDDVLPSIEDIKSIENKNEEDNYFTHPFSQQAAGQTVQPSGSGVTTETNATNKSTVGSDEKAKKHWGKTLDKVRLIANLHTMPHHPHRAQEGSSDASAPLAPYYPPLFDPVFIALSTDQHGHRWVAITDSELTTQGINQWVFRIELQYGDIKWVIKRTIAEFVGLHYTLKFKSSLSDAVPSPPSFPSQLRSWLSSAKGTIRTDDLESNNTAGEKYQIALKRREALTQYLRKLLMRAHMMANYDICEFLEISAVSIVEDMGWKGKEGFLENKVNFVIPRLCQVLKPHLWKKQWVILRDSYLAFISDVASTRINDVFLFDKNLVVMNRTPGILGKYHNHITIANKFRRFEIKGGRREIEEWMKSIQRVLNDSPWVKNHRFGSFAPVRHNSKVRWFVDAEDHFNAVGEAILSAKSEIYILDWWLSPELYLRRPPEKNEEFRLDRLLQRKAEEGVKIYIVVYKEMAVALTINSAHTKLWLQGLHKNIIVVRHPDHRSIDNNVLFWSHHEKVVVVDNRLAFLGGLDLCWGRYDTQSHRLTDYPAEGHPNEVFPGQDYSNPRVKDFLSIAQYDLTLVDRNSTPRMPWHDMTVGMVGPIARDVARHFIQRWNFLKASKGMHRPTVPFLMPKGEYVAARDESSFKGTCRVQILRSSAQWSSGIEREHSIYNAYMECISKSKHYIYIENQFFISATTQDKLLRNKIAQAIVERIKRAHEKGEKYKVFIVIPLIPAFEGDLASKDASAARNVMHFQYITISRGGNSIIEKLREAGIEPADYIGWYSLRNWDKLVPPKKTKDGSKPQNASSESLRDPLSPTATPIPNEKDIWDDDDREHYVSELVYIHDKILIVDDRIVLIGSDMVSSFMDGQEYKAAKFAHSLRTHLFKEHLGLLDFTRWEELVQGQVDIEATVGSHPTHQRSTEAEIKNFETAGPDMVLNHEKRSGSSKADSNTMAKADLFRCVPDDTVHTFDQHRKFLPDKVPHGHVADPELHGREIRNRLAKVRGHLVQFPYDYLKDENMLGSLIRETVTPMVIFT